METSNKQMNIEQIVERAITKAQWLWLVLNFFISVFVFTYLGGFWIIALPFFWIFSYQLILVFTGFYLALTVPEELVNLESAKDRLAAFQEITKKVEEGDIVPGKDLDALIEKAGLNISVILSTSEQKVGAYRGKDIFEWIEIDDPISGKPEKYLFEQIAEQDKAGNFVVPEIEGKYCTLFNQCVYSRPKQ